MHNVFHVSLLKKDLGQQVTVATKLPTLDDKGNLVLVLKAILEMTKRKIKKNTIREFFVRWKYLPEEDATWKGK